MKYILLGTIDSKWLNKQSERYTKSSKKLKQLGIKLENVYYTQGQYDFVDVVTAPGAESVLTFSIWYADKGLDVFNHCQLLVIKQWKKHRVNKAFEY